MDGSMLVNHQNVFSPAEPFFTRGAIFHRRAFFPFSCIELFPWHENILCGPLVRVGKASQLYVAIKPGQIRSQPEKT